MKFSFFIILSVFCNMAMAQRVATFELSPGYEFERNVQTVLQEHTCINQSEKKLYTTELSNRQKVVGANYIGVTSHGDVAVLRDNKNFSIYSCRNAQPLYFNNQMSLNDSPDCVVNEITSASVHLSDGTPMFFRALRYNLEASSLCTPRNSVSVNNSSESSSKEMKEETSSSSLVNQQ